MEGRKRKDKNEEETDGSLGTQVGKHTDVYIAREKDTWTGGQEELREFRTVRQHSASFVRP